MSITMFDVLKRTGSLVTHDVNSTDNNQPWKLKPAVGSRPGSILAFQDLRFTQCRHLKHNSWIARMDPGRDPTAGFSFQGWLLSVLLTSCVKSDPVLFNTVVQHWLLASTVIALPLVFRLSLHPYSNVWCTSRRYWPYTCNQFRRMVSSVVPSFCLAMHQGHQLH